MTPKFIILNFLQMTKELMLKIGKQLRINACILEIEKTLNLIKPSKTACIALLAIANSL